MTTAEFLAQSGCGLEYLSPEMMIAPDIGGSNHPAYLKSLYENDVTITLNQRLTGITREDDGYSAAIFNEYTNSNSTRRFDQIVCDNGTLPADELYFDLKAGSTNLGEVDQDALLGGNPRIRSIIPMGRTSYSVLETLSPAAISTRQSMTACAFARLSDRRLATNFSAARYRDPTLPRKAPWLFEVRRVSGCQKWRRQIHSRYSHRQRRDSSVHNGHSRHWS